jgi:hypothetical protein
VNFLVKFFFKEDPKAIQLKSKKSVARIEAGLRKKISSLSLLDSLTGAYGLRGEVEEGHFELWLRRRMQHNSIRTLTGRLERKNGWTYIDGDLRIGSLHRIFVLFPFLVSVYFIWQGVKDADYLTLFFGLAVPLFSWVAVRFRVFIERDDRESMIEIFRSLGAVPFALKKKISTRYIVQKKTIRKRKLIKA